MINAYKFVPPKRQKYYNRVGKTKKSGKKKIPARVERNMLFWGKYFGKVNFGHFFCPFLKT